MLEKSFGLLFYLKKAKNYEHGPIPVYLRITVDGVERSLSTKRSWDPSRWNNRSNRASGNKEESKALNEYLDVLQNKAYDARKYLIDRGKIITADEIINLISGSDQRKLMLMVLFSQHNTQQQNLIGKGVSKGTCTNFKTSYRHMEEFLKKQYKVSDINILSLDLEFVKRLYNWFRTTKNLNHNSALKNIANMKKIVLNCVDNGWVLSDPFAKFAMSRDEVDTVYLDKKELQAIAAKKIINDRLSRVRDLFVFCCFTGLSFIDIKQLKRSEVGIDAKGELRIYKNRQKTGTISVIPLLPLARSILQKYTYDEECIARDMLIPVLSNQKYNAYLKELADISHVYKPLSSKMARNTFATTVTLANNVPIESISKMMGHKSLKQTQHYAKVLAVKVSEDMSLLQKRIIKTKFISDREIIKESGLVHIIE